MPLSHPPGEAQFDFGQAQAIYRGREIKVMFCVMSLPYSGAFTLSSLRSVRFTMLNSTAHGEAVAGRASPVRHGLVSRRDALRTER